MLAFRKLLFCVGFLAFLAILVNGQLGQDQIPAELKYLFTGEFDNYNPPQEYQKRFLFYLSGYDDDGRPVWVVEFGRWDMKDVILKGEESEKELQKYIDWTIYKMIKSIGDKSTPENPVKEATLIFDMEGYNFEQLNTSEVISFCLKTVRQLLFKAIRFADTVYIINTNYVAHLLLNLVRPLFGSEFSRIDIHGPNKARWRPVLLKKLPREVLPAWYGGVKDFKPLRVYG